MSRSGRKQTVVVTRDSGEGAANAMSKDLLANQTIAVVAVKGSGQWNL